MSAPRGMPGFAGLLWLMLAAAALARGGENAAPVELWRSLPEGPLPPATSEVFGRLIDSCRPAVVAVHTRVRRVVFARDEEPALLFDPWRLFPELPREELEDGVGSGFLIHPDGWVVTNDHVVADAIRVTLSIPGISGPVPARVAGTDARTDLALLKVDLPKPLPALPLGDSDELRVGTWVLAIGNPFGLEAVATKGILSGKGRSLSDLPGVQGGGFEFLQTDAAIDRGSSGGPLINLRGEAVGINAAINNRARGLSFAIPINVAKAVLPQLQRFGRVRRSYLGIAVDDLGWELAGMLGMSEPRGVVISTVKADGPAAQAGVKAGDILLSIGGRPTRSASDIGWHSQTLPPGVPVELEIWRLSGPVRIAVIPRERAAAPSRAGPPLAAAPASAGPGLEVVALDAASAERAGLSPGERGLLVLQARDEAEAAGVRAGDIILQIDGAPARDPEDLDRALSRMPRGGLLRLYLVRQKNALFIALRRSW